jgi:pantoate--beta-alanine ligase
MLNFKGFNMTATAALQLISSREALRAALQEWRIKGLKIAFVPTMGNLHAGHLHLVEQALARADRVVVSIFVNPLQFGVGEDFDAYPRTLQADQQKLSNVLAQQESILFLPQISAMYLDGMKNSTRVEVPHLSDILCGASRAGHFVGVATIVTKLFNLVQPDVALFGEKDFQQVLIIKRMVQDLFMPLEIVSIPTVREADGLAMSSRNGYLSVEERARAPYLYQILSEARRQILDGNAHYIALEHHAAQLLAANGFIPDYIAIRNAKNLQPATAQDQNLVVLAAAKLGRTRLIDNLRVDKA